MIKENRLLVEEIFKLRSEEKEKAGKKKIWIALQNNRKGQKTKRTW